jgi:hypothetical protein
MPIVADVEVFPMCIVDATEFATVCFKIELRQFLVRHKYYSLESLYTSSLLTSCDEFKKYNQMLISLRSKGKLKFHINKASLGYFYCNVQFCFCYSRDI